MDAPVNPATPGAAGLAFALLIALQVLVLVLALVSLWRAKDRMPLSVAAIWAVVVLLVPFLGPLVWLVLGRNREWRQLGER